MYKWFFLNTHSFVTLSFKLYMDYLYKKTNLLYIEKCTRKYDFSLDNSHDAMPTKPVTTSRLHRVP